jgi:hypothetical protein
VFAAASAKGHGAALKARNKRDGDSGGGNQEIFHEPNPIKTRFSQPGGK